MALRIECSKGCCGLAEIFNFNYSAISMDHFHREVGGWAQIHQPQKKTSIEEIRKAIEHNQYYGGFFATIGVDQEYIEPLLLSVGFKKTEFLNRTHLKTKVTHFFLCCVDYIPASKAASNG
jgi:hypothetical protein